MAECFCGCGRDIGFGRRGISNKAAKHVASELDVLRGAAEVEPPPEGVDALREIVARGDRLREPWREYVHGTRARGDFDREPLHELIDDIAEQRKRLALSADYVGWDMLKASKLFSTGRRAPARIVGIEDTGVTVNNSPRAEIILRVEPDGEEPFEVRKKLMISRVQLPRIGEPVEVAYDPDDHEQFTFRVPDLTDDAARAFAAGAAAQPADDPLDRIQKLHELHEAGALTAEEFAREKAQVLGQQR
ncbi:MAG: SHOCT domain-containing protein [Thermoleophilaceae bacterium]